MTDLFAAAPPALEGIHVGIGGWVYAPWRAGMFYPEGLVQRRELEYASRHVTAIEINGTYYGAQKPATYAKWRDEVPPGFVFSAKAPRRITQSRTLAGTGAQVEDFIGGIAELGDTLGPLVWQFEQGHRLQPDDLEGSCRCCPSALAAACYGTCWRSVTTPPWMRRSSRGCANMAWPRCSLILTNTPRLPISPRILCMHG